MAWYWTEKSWTPLRKQLAHAVYEATRRESAYAPMLSPLGSGNLLLRSYDRQRMGIGARIPETIDLQSVLKALQVTDAERDSNRFSGPLPAAVAKPAIHPKRGGLYCSEDIFAAIAELMHYSNPNLSRRLIGRPARLNLFTHRCFISLRAVGELDVVNLESASPAMLPFFARLEKDPAVARALAAAGYRELFQALYAPRDYSAARGLGLGLESNPGIDGIRLISARDYKTRTDGEGQTVMRTGDNVMLFGLDQRIALDKVRIESIHLVDPVAGSAGLQVTHYALRTGLFHKTTHGIFTP